MIAGWLSSLTEGKAYSTWKSCSLSSPRRSSSLSTQTEALSACCMCMGQVKRDYHEQQHERVHRVLVCGQCLAELVVFCHGRLLLPGHFGPKK